MVPFNDVKLILSVKNNDPTVRDYNIYNQRVVPGLVLLDSIHTFLLSKGFVQNKTLQFKDILFKKPIFVQEGFIVKIQITIRKNEEGLFVSGQSQMIQEKDQTGAKWDENFEFYISIADEEEQSKGDISTMISHTQDIFELSKVYDVERESGVFFKEFMLANGQVNLSTEGVLGVVRLGEIAQKYVEAFFIHPAYLYAGISIIHYQAYKEIKSQKAFIPTYIQRLTFYKDLRNEAYIKIDPQKVQTYKDETLTAELEIYDSEGSLCVQAIGVSLNGINEKQLTNSANESIRSTEIKAFNGNYLKQYAQEAYNTKELIVMDLKRISADFMDIGEQDISVEQSFFEMGFDSKRILELSYRIGERVGKKINPTIIFGNPSIESLSIYIHKYLNHVYEEQFKRLNKEERETPVLGQREVPETVIDKSDSMEDAYEEEEEVADYLLGEEEEKDFETHIFGDEEEGFEAQLFGDEEEEAFKVNIFGEDETEEDEFDLDETEEDEFEQDEFEQDEFEEDENEEAEFEEDENEEYEYEQHENEENEYEEDEYDENEYEEDEYDEDEYDEEGYEEDEYDEDGNKTDIQKEFKERIVEDLKEILSEICGYTLEDMDHEHWEYSKVLHTTLLMTFIRKISEKVGRVIQPAVLARYDKLSLLAEYIHDNFGAEYQFEGDHTFNDENQDYPMNTNSTNESTEALENVVGDYEPETFEQEEALDQALEDAQWKTLAGDDEFNRTEGNGDPWASSLENRDEAYGEQEEQPQDAHETIEGGEQDESGSFLPRIPGAQFNRLDGYILEETEIIPFAHFIQEVFEAYKQIHEDVNDFRIQELTWGQPITRTEYVDISTAFLEVADEVHFFIYSDAIENKKNIHLKGRLTPVKNMMNYAVNIEDIEARLQAHEENISNKIKRVGLEVNEALFKIENILGLYKETLSYNRVEQEHLSASQKKSIIIESVIQTILGNVEGMDVLYESVLLPHSCKSVQFTEQIDVKEFYVYAKEVLRSRERGVISFSVRVTDMQGNMLARMKDFCVKLNQRKDVFEHTRNLEDEGVVMGQIIAEKAENYENRFKETPIALVGLSGVLPSAIDVEGFFENILTQKGVIAEWPVKRKEWSGQDREIAHKEMLEGFYCSCIDAVQEFDAKFFGIEENQARFMDPQQRLLLQSVWNAVEDAGYKMSEFSQKKTGVFIGAMSAEYESMVLRNVKRSTPEMYKGLMQFYLANRVSEVFGLSGPSEVLNTGHTSTLTAIKRAIDEIHNGTCEVAIVGAVNLILTEDTSKLLNSLGVLSHSGQSRPFDEQADGYVRSEAVGVIVLKSLKKAQKDQDHIYGVIRGIAMGYASSNDTQRKTSEPMQQDVMLQAWQMAEVNPFDLEYIETAADGNIKDDIHELEWIKGALQNLPEHYKAERLKNKGNIRIGSVKAHIGHAEAASGMVSLFYLLMLMKHSKKVGLSKGFHKNHAINLEGVPVELLSNTVAWENTLTEIGKLPKLAAMNTKGFGGIFGHMVLEEYIQPDFQMPHAQHEQMIVFSAMDQVGLKEYVKKFLAFLKREGEQIRIEDVAYTLQIGREAMSERLVIVTADIEGLKNNLRQFLDGKNQPDQMFAGNIHMNHKRFIPIFDGEEAEAFVRLLMENKNYKNLAQLWILGIEFDWKQLYLGRRVRRISLPGYSFKGQRYWYSNKMPLQGNAINNASAGTGHMDGKTTAENERTLVSQTGENTLKSDRESLSSSENNQVQEDKQDKPVERKTMVEEPARGNQRDAQGRMPNRNENDKFSRMDRMPHKRLHPRTNSPIERERMGSSGEKRGSLPEQQKTQNMKQPSPQPREEGNENRGISTDTETE